MSRPVSPGFAKMVTMQFSFHSEHMIRLHKYQKTITLRMSGVFHWSLSYKTFLQTPHKAIFINNGTKVVDNDT